MVEGAVGEANGGQGGAIMAVPPWWRGGFMVEDKAKQWRRGGLSETLEMAQYAQALGEAGVARGKPEMEALEDEEEPWRPVARLTFVARQWRAAVFREKEGKKRERRKNSLSE